MKYLGVDHGTKYIGLAMGDDETKLALPYDTITESDIKRQISAIEQIVLDEGVDKVVVGYPLTLEGTEDEQAGVTLSFITELSGTLSIPIEREDERLTSKFAQTLQHEAGGDIYDEHALAATLILQSYIDRQR